MFTVVFPAPAAPRALLLPLLALACGASTLQGQSSRDGLPPLETLSAIRRDADRDRIPDRVEQRVRVRGVLAATPGTHDSRGSVGYLVDEETGVGLYAANGKLKGLKAGELLEVVGEVGSFNGAEQIRVERASRLGTRPLPAPEQVEIPALHGETHSGRLVRVRGTLRVAKDEDKDERRRFSLSDGKATIPLYVPAPIHESPRFPLTVRDEGREVEVVGIAGQFDRSEPYTSGYQVIPRSPADIRFRTPSRSALWGILGGAAALMLGAALVAYRMRARRLHRESHTDPMTGLLNRRGYEAALQRALRASRKTRTPLAMLVVDLDNFKRANDEHGHLVGDAVLRGVAALLLETVRETDVVCRYAGDEFVVLLPRLGEAAVLEVADRIVRHLRAVTVEMDGDRREIPLGASVGVAMLDPDDETNGDALFRRADAALYQSKREGKGQARFALRAS
jgi:diguanylate cyclase (GGDEF)-like protein